MNVDDMRQVAHAQNDQLGDIEGDINQWFKLLVDNCADDPENAQAYIIRATAEVSDYIARSANVFSCMDGMIEPMRQNKKLRKWGEISQIVMPVLIMAKLLQLMDQRLGE